MNKCIIEGCEKKARAKFKPGLCVGHLARKRLGHPLDGPLDRRVRSHDRLPCDALGCYLKSITRGLCSQHYRRKHIEKQENWERPLNRRLPQGSTMPMVTRIRKDFVAVIDEQAKVHGYTRAEWVRVVIEKQVSEWKRPNMMKARN